MSRKNRFKKRRGFIGNNQNQEAKPKEKERDIKNEYNMKAEFASLAAIVFFFLAVLVGIYCYDRQTDILAKTAERLMKMLS